MAAKLNTLPLELMLKIFHLCWNDLDESSNRKAFDMPYSTTDFSLERKCIRLFKHEHIPQLYSNLLRISRQLYPAASMVLYSRCKAFRFISLPDVWTFRGMIGNHSYHIEQLSLSVDATWEHDGTSAESWIAYFHDGLFEHDFPSLKVLELVVINRPGESPRGWRITEGPIFSRFLTAVENNVKVKQILFDFCLLGFESRDCHWGIEKWK
ncbi:hypothetical protein MMC13_000854 [Lambiella insularis]|nr:hypothetical protein [Lambiella insularis]